MPRDFFGLEGETLGGKYHVLSAVAEGGFGVVYRGRHDTLDKQIALKVLKFPEASTEAFRESFLASFAQEAKLIANLQHHAIVQVLDFGQSTMPRGEVAPWMVLEWLDGSTLEADLAARKGRGGRSPGEALALLRPAFQALAHAHESGIAHRDVKPANLMLPRAGGARHGTATVKLMDFGIAKVMSPEEAPSRGETQTKASFVAYSPRYAALEQISRQRTGPWTDVHAMALVLTELLCDEPPYGGEDGGELLIAAISPERPTPKMRGVAVGPWEEVIAKAMAVRPDARFQNCGAFLDALERDLLAAEHARASQRAAGASAVPQAGPSQLPDPRAWSPPDAMLRASSGPQGTVPSTGTEVVPHLHSTPPGLLYPPTDSLRRAPPSQSRLKLVAIGVVLAGAALGVGVRVSSHQPEPTVAPAGEPTVAPPGGQPASLAPTPTPSVPPPSAVAPIPTPVPPAPPPAEQPPVMVQTIVAPDRQVGHRHAPTPAAPTLAPPLAAPAPVPTPAVAAAPDDSSPMDQARACLRSSPSMAEGNQCVVSVLRGRANSESEIGLLCTTYRTMSRTSDAVRCMRSYIQRYPDGARVAQFQQYIDGNSQ